MLNHPNFLKTLNELSLQNVTPIPSKFTNNLLSAIVAKYPPGSVTFAKPWKFKVFGFTEVVAPSDNWILDILAVTIGNLVVPLGKVTNL